MFYFTYTYPSQPPNAFHRPPYKYAQIYSTAEPGGNSGGAFLSVKNSTFEGNIAENHGGAIASWGEGEVELSNCSFVGNEAVGTGDYRRAGTGGAVYASAGVFVTVRDTKREKRGAGGGRGIAAGSRVFVWSYGRGSRRRTVG